MQLRFFFATLLMCKLSFLSAQNRLVQYVDPFIGTGGHGHTYPGATVPFGMIQLSPDNGTQGWDWCSGYHYSDSMIAGFSHTHLSGTGIGDLCDISVMPLINRKADTTAYRASFSHRDEKAEPGYYRVKLSDSKILAELTTTSRTALHRYTFPGGKASIKVDLGFAINWDRPVETFFRQISPTRFAGYRKSTGWAKQQVVYFALELSKPVSQVSVFSEKVRQTTSTASGVQVLSFLEFPVQPQEQVLMKVSLSSADEAGAIAGLAGISGWDFNRVKIQASAEWEKELSKIKVSSTNQPFLRTFYTALYHTYLAPVLFNDAGGAYKGADGKIYTSKRPVYSVHSLWDTFRSANPLFTLTQPGRVADIINSYLSFYRQRGLLPVWDLHFNETNTMTGYHAVPVIADAILKDIPGFDRELAYTAMKASAAQNIRGTSEYRQYGYVPQDKHGWSVTMTLEYAYDDWCIAQVAKKLGKLDDYALFMKKSEGYRHLFDSKSGFFRAKTSDGSWVEPFDPYHSEHGFEGMYIEGTAWQHTFFVPHAVDGYAELLGGRAALTEKLDSLFSTSSHMTGENVSSDISGLIGQYAHGNEPSHHIAYMYTVLGSPHKTAVRVRQIMNTMYSDRPDGLSGNEDCGQMSAWYVWSALGFYPMNPSSGAYVLGSPKVDRADIQLPENKTFSVRVKRQSPVSIYIKSVSLNGSPIPLHSITHQQIIAGGILDISLSDVPASGK